MVVSNLNDWLNAHETEIEQLGIENVMDACEQATNEHHRKEFFEEYYQDIKTKLGAYDAYVEVRAETLNEMCAALVVQKAGEHVSTAKGTPLMLKPNMRQTLIVARDKETHSEILNKIKDKDFEN